MTRSAPLLGTNEQVKKQLLDEFGEYGWRIIISSAGRWWASRTLNGEELGADAVDASTPEELRRQLRAKLRPGDAR